MFKREARESQRVPLSKVVLRSGRLSSGCALGLVAGLANMWSAPLDASQQPQLLAAPGSQGRSMTLCNILSCEGLWVEYISRLQYFQLTMHLSKGNPITHQEALAPTIAKPRLSPLCPLTTVFTRRGPLPVVFCPPPTPSHSTEPSKLTSKDKLLSFNKQG